MILFFLTTASRWASERKSRDVLLALIKEFWIWHFHFLYVYVENNNNEIVKKRFMHPLFKEKRSGMEKWNNLIAIYVLHIGNMNVEFLLFRVLYEYCEYVVSELRLSELCTEQTQLYSLLHYNFLRWKIFSVLFVLPPYCVTLIN